MRGFGGCQVLWGRCHEAAGAPPYWPWVQAIRSYVREQEPDRLRSDEGRILNPKAYIEAQTGEVERCLETLREGPIGGLMMGIALRAEVARTIGLQHGLDEAESAAVARLSQEGIQPLFRFVPTTGLAMLAVLRRDADSARAYYQQLQRPKSQQVGSFWGIFISQGRLFGLLAQLIGEPERATGHFEDAIAFCRKAGYRPQLAWSCYDYADMLLERNSEGDRQKAMRLLDESLAISRELGMRPLMERALSRRKILRA
jgi:tetratricopeptide (TPR) repeat protein